MIGRALFGLARQPWAGRMVGWAFQHMTFAIPLNRLKETSTLIAFYHPKPAYSVHVLIVPRRVCGSWQELGENDADLMRDLVVTVQQLVRDLGLEQQGYRLVVNGGALQEVQQLHFHLISED